MPARKEVIVIGGREVAISNPDKVYFPRAGHTKLDLVRYFIAVADGALTGMRDRPMALKRFVDGAESEPFFQKRAPDSRPPWLRVATLTFPSGRTADEVVLVDITPRVDPAGVDRIRGFMAAHIEDGFATLEEAAIRLGIDPTTLWRKRKRYGLT
jgi:transcriptional regulator of acetoin/glycerol metabolism